MTKADGYTAGKFTSAATVVAGRYDIFELDSNGKPVRHIGTFTAGTPRDGTRAAADVIAIVNGLAAREEELRRQERELDASGRI